jgi:hypothetical protein
MYSSIHKNGQAFLTIIAILYGGAWPAAAEDIVYRGKMRCAPIPGATGELVVAIAMTARDGLVAYQRPIIALDGRTVLGKESGTGKIAPDGSVVLRWRFYKFVNLHRAIRGSIVQFGHGVKWLAVAHRTSRIQPSMYDLCEP